MLLKPFTSTGRGALRGRFESMKCQCTMTAAAIVAVSAILVPSADVAAQATTRSPHEFTNIAAACPRSDGSVLVSDIGEGALLVIAPNGAVRSLGRRGSGPGEFQSPGGCFTLPGDTVLVLDRVLRRFTVVAPNGTLSTLPYPPALGTGWYEPLGVDESARVVLRGQTTGGRTPAITWDRSSGKVDTLLRVDAGAQRHMSVGGATVAREVPFVPRAAAIGGLTLGVAVVHPDPFAVEWWRDGAHGKGDPVPFTAVPVDDRDVERYIASQAPPANTVARGSDGKMVTIPQRRWTLENFGLTRADIPARKPSFDPAGLFAAPSGALWIRVHRPSAERSERYEVFESTGEWGTPVTLPADRRLVGIGRGECYVVATTDDGIQFFERVRLRPGTGP
jgi:hypothetical protein